MTVRTSWYIESNKIGVDLNKPEAIAVTTAPEIPGPRANLGDIVHGNDGSVWMFVKASATVTSKNVIAIDSTCNAVCATSALMSSNLYTYGLAQFSVTAAATGEYFWALLSARAGASVNAYGTCATGTTLYISPSYPGVVTTSVSVYGMQGMFAIAALATTTTLGSCEVVFSQPIAVTVSV